MFRSSRLVILPFIAVFVAGLLAACGDTADDSQSSAGFMDIPGLGVTAGTAAGAGPATLVPAGTAGVGAAPATGGTGAAGNPASVMAGTGGTAASPVVDDGTMGTAGGGGAADSTPCTITADASLSSAISTVGIVTWSTDLPNVDAAHIEFGLAGSGQMMTAPVDLAEPNYRTLLLGMKAQHDYVFRIVAEQGGATCTSDEYMLTTGALPAGAPSVTRQLLMDGQQSTGFIVTSPGIAGLGGFGGVGGGSSPAYIFDTDGDLVWWADGPANCSRAHMSYDGKDMWMMELNVDNAGGELRRVSMDGLDMEAHIAGMDVGHHDFAVVPGGIIAATIWLSAAQNADNALVERHPDGTITTIVANLRTLYNSSGYHPNAIHYYPDDDTYTISDRNPNAFVKVSRQGQLLWQFGGTLPLGNYFPGTWQVNHGHHLLPNGNFLFFNNGSGFGAGSSLALEFKLDEATWTATEVWRYAPSSSPVLGDVERLPNGNTLVTASNAGVMEEVSPAGAVVQKFTAASFGYAEFRESLYGPPPR